MLVLVTTLLLELFIEQMYQQSSYMSRKTFFLKVFNSVKMKRTTISETHLL